MKKYSIVLIVLAVFLSVSCKKDELEKTTISTIEITDITPSEAQSGGTINSYGKLAILSRGVCWNERQIPTLENFYTSYTTDSLDAGTYKSILLNLNAGKTYYVRAYYTNENDTVYGNHYEFTTPDNIQFNEGLNYGSVTDIDGNIYKTIEIGGQVWMAENLKSAQYQNGDSIAHVSNLDNWYVDSEEMSSGAYNYYDNEDDNKHIHGSLYNWNAITDNRNIAPEGWRVATVDDWKELMKYVDPATDGHETKNNSTRKLRETKTAHWYWEGTSGYSSTNSTGFTSLASGRNQFGFTNFGYYAVYWASSESLDAMHVYLSDHINLSYSQYKCLGLSVRCVKE